MYYFAGNLILSLASPYTCNRYGSELTGGYWHFCKQIRPRHIKADEDLYPDTLITSLRAKIRSTYLRDPSRLGGNSDLHDHHLWPLTPHLMTGANHRRGINHEIGPHKIRGREREPGISHSLTRTLTRNCCCCKYTGPGDDRLAVNTLNGSMKLSKYHTEMVCLRRKPGQSRDFWLVRSFAQNGSVLWQKDFI